MIRNTLTLVIVFSLLFTFVEELEAKEFEIIAVVNDDVITNHALQQRTTIAIRSAGIKDSQAARARLALQILESLIDERLQAQEAEKRKIKLSETEVERTKVSILKQNNLEPDNFKKFLKMHKLSEQPFLEQLTAQLLWQKILLRALQPKIYVSKEETAEFIERLERNKNNTEVLISEIMLPVAMPEQEDNAKKLAHKLVEELNKGGNFELFARQFSRSNTARNGGNIGWIGESDIETKIREAISPLKPGEITQPIRTSGGYFIMKLNDKRIGREDNTPPNEGKVRDFLVQKKLEVEARKFMKTLRRAAYIERRI